MKEFIIEFNKFLTILSKLLKSTNKIERIEGYLVLLTIFYFICIKITYSIVYNQC